MLAKLNRNKFLLIFLLIFCCAKKVYYSTEIICPTGTRILVRYARADEVRAAIIKADEEKRIYRTSENYTVIKLPGNRSFRIEKMSPEESIKCSTEENVMGQVDKYYIKYF